MSDRLISGEKKIGGRVIIRSEAGGLVIVIKELIALAQLAGACLALLVIMAMLLGLAPDASSLIYGHPKYPLPLVVLFLCALYFAVSMLTNRETLTVFQGTLKITDRKFFVSFSREFQARDITRLGLNIPEDKFYPGYKSYYTAFLTPRNRLVPGSRLRGAVAFQYGDSVVEFARGLDRVSATYILNELQNSLGLK